MQGKMLAAPSSPLVGEDSKSACGAAACLDALGEGAGALHPAFSSRKTSPAFSKP